MTDEAEPQQACHSPTKILDSGTVAAISSFVEHQSANVQQMLAAATTAKQQHRTVEAYIQNLFDFVLDLMPTNKSTARFISEWVYNFYAHVKIRQGELSNVEPQTLDIETPGNPDLEESHDLLEQEKTNGTLLETLTFNFSQHL